MFTSIWPSEGHLGTLVAPNGRSGDELLAPKGRSGDVLGEAQRGFRTLFVTPNGKIDHPNVRNRSQKGPKMEAKST